MYENKCSKQHRIGHKLPYHWRKFHIHISLVYHPNINQSNCHKNKKRGADEKNKKKTKKNKHETKRNETEKTAASDLTAVGAAVRI